MEGARPPIASDEGRRLVRRRATLAAALTGITVAGAGAAALTLLPKRDPRLRFLDDGPPLSDTGVTKVERVYSRARRRKVELITTLPSTDVRAAARDSRRGAEHARVRL